MDTASKNQPPKSMAGAPLSPTAYSKKMFFTMWIFIGLLFTYIITRSLKNEPRTMITMYTHIISHLVGSACFIVIEINSGWTFFNIWDSFCQLENKYPDIRTKAQTTLGVIYRVHITLCLFTSFPMMFAIFGEGHAPQLCYL